MTKSTLPLFTQPAEKERTPTAWVRHPSGLRLNILDPRPTDWTDEDLAIGLSRTFRWGGYSKWPRPLSVAQHALTVLTLTARILNRPLTPEEVMREILHDADEALIGGYDAIRPLKPILGERFQQITERLLDTVFTRYAIRKWHMSEYIQHKHADHLAAASEAVHVAGWTPAEISEVLEIDLAPLNTDPLAAIYDCQPWEPWEPDLAAERFLDVLTRNGQGRENPPVLPTNPAGMNPKNPECSLDCRWCPQDPVDCKPAKELDRITAEFESDRKEFAKRLGIPPEIITNAALDFLYGADSDEQLRKIWREEEWKHW